MDPITANVGSAQAAAGSGAAGPLGGLGAGLLGGLAQAGASAYQTHVNVREARRNRNFQERMSSTAWQRGIADMKKAGINPMVAFDKGGASTPTGATAQAAKMDIAPVMSQIYQSVASADNQSSAAALNRAKAVEINSTMHQRIESAIQNLAILKDRGIITEAERFKMNQTLQSQIDQIKSQSQLTGHQATTAKAEAQFWDAAGPAGKFMQFISRLFGRGR